MKRMTAIAHIAAALLLGAGVFAVWHAVRTAPVITNQAAPRRRPPAAPMDRLEAGIKIDWTDYQKNSPSTRELMDRLRHEEIRQKPQEGRN